ncbi:ISL3 family transposase [Acinetobacter colistiniresistens]|uniref:ISL3 family transposase n=1 Tax=Acinetobacter colistiniresistens TaxID=280145 RepID=UPI00208F7B3C|nr:ISL3 family transposase [Acinetobacter colistiniresistens]
MTDILDLPNWAVLSVERGDELIINAEYQIQPDCCLKCGSSSFYKHGPKPIVYRDSPVRGSPVVINAVLKRYRCRDCGGTFLQPVEGIQPEMRMTERCFEYIQEQSLDDTFVRIAKNIGCDDKTVRTIANQYIAKLSETYEPNVAGWIGLDETRLDGKFRFVITDIANRRPIDMLIDREQGTVSDWLWRHRHADIQGFAMDMWRPYKKVVNTIFPNAVIVIDKFHVVRMANQAMEGMRVRLSKDRVKAIGRAWMRRKSLLRMRYKNLDEHGKYNVDMWLDNEPDIAIAHNLKELFYLIYEMPTRQDAEALLDEWLSLVPDEFKKSQKDFRPLVTIFKEWRNEIMNYFDHRITNGYTEALNGVAKVMNRGGRGYTFEMIRAKYLFRKMPSAEHFNYEKADRMRLISIEQPVQQIKPVYRVNKTMIRHLLLAKHEYRCQSCLGIFESKDLYATWLNMDKEYSLDNATLLCNPCRNRFDSTRD